MLSIDVADRLAVVAGMWGGMTLYSCKRVVLATGFEKPNVPDIPGLEENSVTYNDMPADNEFYENKTVAIIGAGNAGFETFKAVMDNAAYVHIHGRSHIRMAWETHYVGDLRSVNVVPVDNYQLKSQDILHLPSPVGLTAEDTVVAKETMPDGSEKICMKDANHDKMAKWLENGDENLPAHLKGVQPGHSLTFEARFKAVDRYCYDIIIRCTGFKIDTSILDFPIETEGGRSATKYASLSPLYAVESVPGFYVAGTLGHVRDFRRSSGGFVHGFRYTARALFKALEQEHEGVRWPRDEVWLDDDVAAYHLDRSDAPPGQAKQSLTQKITDRMDTSSGLYQMFGELADLIILPKRDDDSSTAEYLEEVPLAAVPGFVERREYVTLSMEYGPDFHGHERVLREDRVFHNFDPAKAHKSQFLHPILRYFSQGEGWTVPTKDGKGATASHHVLEDTYTNFTIPAVHVAPMSAFLERFRTKPLMRADTPLKLKWRDVAPMKQGRDTGAPPVQRETVKNQMTDENNTEKAAMPLESMKAKQLKGLLGARGLDARGTKAQLISRLESAMKAEL